MCSAYCCAGAQTPSTSDRSSSQRSIYCCISQCFTAKLLLGPYHITSHPVPRQLDFHSIEQFRSRVWFIVSTPQQIVTGSIGSHLYVDKSVHCLVSILSRVLNLEPVSVGHFMYLADREEIRISSRWAPAWMLSSITAYLHGHDQAFRKSSNNNGINPVTNACWAISEGLQVGYNFILRMARRKVIITHDPQ